MASAYPGAVDALVRPDGTDPLSDGHAALHNATSDAVEAVQTELGTTPSGSAATVAARFTAAESATADAQADATTALADAATADGKAVTAQATADAAVSKATYDAHSVLAATIDDTPAAVTVAEQTLLGRKTGGNIAALTVACFAYLQSGARFVPDGPLYKDFKTGPQATAKLLQARKLERYADSVRHDDRTPSIFEVADLFYEPRKPTNLVSIATSAHMELPPGAIDLSALEANDGPGRDLRWGLLRKLPAGARGESRLWLEGRVVGNVRAVLGVMAGTNTLLETALQPGPQGEVAQTFTLRSPDHREVRIRMRLEGGEGAFWGRRIAWSPYSSRLFPAAGLTVPGEAVSSN